MKNSLSARSKIYRITLDAMLIAIFVILSLVPSEISWASLPVILCAFLIGPVDTVVIALCGSFVEQMWYGLSFASIIWMLPWALFSLFVGLAAFFARKNEKVWKIVLICVLGELLLNVANTSALLYFGYVHVDPASFAEDLPLGLVVVLTYVVRMPHAIIRAILSSVAIPLLMPPLRRALGRLYSR